MDSHKNPYSEDNEIRKNSNGEFNVNINGQDIKTDANGNRMLDTGSGDVHGEATRRRTGQMEDDESVQQDVPGPGDEGAVGGNDPDDPKVLMNSDFSGYDSGYFDYGKKRNESLQSSTIHEEESSPQSSNDNHGQQQKTRNEIRKKRAKKLKEKQQTQQTRRSSLVENRRDVVVEARRRLSIDQQADSTEEETEEQQAVSGGLNTLLMLHKLKRFLNHHAPEEHEADKVLADENTTKNVDEERARQRAGSIPSIILNDGPPVVDIDTSKADSIKPGLLKPAFRMDLGAISDTDEVFTADTVLSKQDCESDKPSKTRTESIIVDDDSENKAGIIYDTSDVSQITPEQLKDIGIELHEGEVLKFKQVLVLDDEEDKEGHHHHHIIPLNDGNAVNDTKLEEITKQAEKAMDKKPRFRARTLGSLRWNREDSTDGPPGRMPTLTRDTYMRFFQTSREATQEPNESETRIQHGYSGIMGNLDRIQARRQASGLDTSGLGGYHKSYRYRHPEYLSDSESSNAVFVYPPTIPKTNEKPNSDIEYRRQLLAKNLEKDNEKRERQDPERTFSVVSFSDVKKMYEDGDRNEPRERSRSMLDTLHPTWSVREKKGKFENSEEKQCEPNGRERETSDVQTSTSANVNNEENSNDSKTKPGNYSNANSLENENEVFYETNLDEDLDIVELRHPSDRESRSRVRSAPAMPVYLHRGTARTVSQIASTPSGTTASSHQASPRAVAGEEAQPSKRGQQTELLLRDEASATVAQALLAPPVDQSRKGSMGEDWFLSSFSSTQHLKLPKKKVRRDNSPFRDDSDDWFYSFDASTEDGSSNNNNSNNNNSNNKNNNDRLRMVVKPKRRDLQKQQAVDDHSVEQQIAELCTGYDTFQPKPPPQPRSRSNARRVERQWDELPPVHRPQRLAPQAPADGYLSDSCGYSTSQRLRQDSGYNSISSPRESIDVLRCMDDEGSDDELLRQKCLDVFRTWHHRDAVHKEFNKLQKFNYRRFVLAKTDYKISPSDDNSTSSGTASSSSGSSSSRTKDSVFH